MLKIYRCFSRPLKEFLEDNGQECLFKGVQDDDSRTIWLFERNKKLSDLLDKWSSNKPNVG